MSDESAALAAETYLAETDDAKVNVTLLVDEVQVSSSKKIQLEQFEPISESVTLTATIPEAYTEEERLAALETLSELSRDACEQAVAKRYEAHVRKEAFGN